MTEIFSASKMKIHVIWAALSTLAAVMGGVIIGYNFGLPWVVLWLLHTGLLYTLGLLIMVVLIRLMKTQARSRQTTKITSDIAGTVGRAAPLIREMYADFRALRTAEQNQRSLELSSNRAPRNYSDGLIHEAAAVTLMKQGLTQTVRKSLDHLRNARKLLVITQSDWPAAATKLGLITHEQVVSVTPAELPQLSVASIARESIIIVDRDCIDELKNNHLRWITFYLRWGSPDAGIYFTDSGNDELYSVDPSALLKNLDCLITVKNNITAAFPLKIRQQDY